jgi:hypothetical protein
MERLPNDEHMPLEARFHELKRKLDTSNAPHLQKLNEYFAIGEQVFLQQVKKAGKDREEIYQVAKGFQELRTGTWQKKWIFCLGEKKSFLEAAKEQEKRGNIELMTQSYIKANNWQKRADALKPIRRNRIQG